jgi:putative transposase
MSTYTQIIYQIVFGTKFREKTLHQSGRDELFKYITGIIQNKKCHLYIINGVEDHIHIITHLHPSISLASLVKDIKVASTLFIKEKKLFDHFKGWQEGYGAFTYSVQARHNLIEYVKNQEEHHRKKSFQEEFMGCLRKHDIEFDERYFL